MWLFAKKYPLPAIGIGLSATIFLVTRLNEILSYFQLGTFRPALEIIAFATLFVSICAILFQWHKKQEQEVPKNTETVMPPSGFSANNISGNIIISSGSVHHIASEPEQKVATKAAGSPTLHAPFSLVNQRVFEDQDLYFWELVRHGEFLIRDKTFRRCTFFGPAVIGFTRNVEVNGFGLSVKRIEDALIEVSEDRIVLGVYGFRDCVIRDCSFEKVSIIGPPSLLKEITEALRDER